MSSFLTNHGDPVRERIIRDLNRFSLHLLVADRRDHQACDAYMRVARRKSR